VHERAVVPTGEPYSFSDPCTEVGEEPELRNYELRTAGKGPALTLLLAGPALSLPSILVIRTFMGTKKTVVFLALVVVTATTAGMIHGAIA
jgi:uncharacterized protein